MANLSEDIQCAGSDTRPPMLDKADFASWQQRIRLYCRVHADSTVKTFRWNGLSFEEQASVLLRNSFEIMDVEVKQMSLSN
ncbi:hypothetical protein Tco_0553774 [Tanacetum coccineum]